MARLKDYLIERQARKIDAKTAKIEEVLREYSKQSAIDQAIMAYSEYKLYEEANTGHRDKQ